MSKHAETLVKANGFSDVIKVVKGKVEEIDIPEKVDVIISEPMGFMLIHERMLESYVEARFVFRLMFRNPVVSCLMFGVGTIFFSWPLKLSDNALYKEQYDKVQSFGKREISLVSICLHFESRH